MSILDNYEAADAAFKSSRVLTQSNDVLLEHLHGLSNQNNTNSGTQHRDMIRGFTINQILLQRHLQTLNKSNSRLQLAVLWLTLLSTVSSVIQIWAVLK